MTPFRWSTRPIAVLALIAVFLSGCATPPPPQPTPVPPTPPPVFQPLDAAGLAATPQVPTGKNGIGQRGGTFTEAATSDAVNFHPYNSTDTGSHEYQGMVYGANLWRYNKTT